MTDRNMKLNIFAFVVLGVTSVVALLAISYMYRSDRAGWDVVPGKNATEVELTCSGGYAISALYYAPDAGGIMRRLALKVVAGNSARYFDMMPAMSGSGARYADKDEVYSFWEHQDEFTFYKKDINLAVCRKMVSKPAGCKMTEAAARSIAERSCIKGGGALSAGMYNKNSKTWWFDANLNSTRRGCNPACVVSEQTRTAEINWRCTGLMR
ncbi:MliC family protein [Candidatus Uhrbacteria bacterium]|nr:MliC family protein [Candidatus Uhrbacteria bacterium]